MLLHVPAPLVALLSIFVILGLLSARDAFAVETRGSTILVAAWAVVGLASAAVWVLWWRLPEDEMPQPGYLEVLGHGTTGLAAILTVLTVRHHLAARSGPSPRS